MTDAPITASMLYDLVQCPHRVTMDLFGDKSTQDEINPFVELLWEKGNLYEKEVISKLELPFLDLSPYADDEKERQTTAAMERGEALIYNGRIRADDLLGNPDLLRKEGNGYVAGDIKAGSGLEGSDEDTDGKPKTHYAVQLALYTDILERKGLSSSRRPFVWDVHGEEVVYDLNETQGIKNPTPLWTTYQDALNEARETVARKEETLPAYSGVCKLCHWYSACLGELKAKDDLTLIPELGRAKRDVMIMEIPTVVDFSETDISRFVESKNKTIFKGVGIKSLTKFQNRAKLLTVKDSTPYLTEPLSLPFADIEIFFDIEVDPMRDICYMHGFIERHNGDNKTEKYVCFFTNNVSEAEEKRAFKEAWHYLHRIMQPCRIYHYSPYERTWWRKLQKRYPDVCLREEVDALFEGRMIDLMAVVNKHTEWPTNDRSIKTLAKYLGFNWRDTHPSGAASIEWFDNWIKTGDTAIKQRIIDYNEDDCLATRVLLDGIRSIDTAPAEQQNLAS